MSRSSGEDGNQPTWKRISGTALIEEQSLSLKQAWLRTQVAASGLSPKTTSRFSTAPFRNIVKLRESPG